MDRDLTKPLGLLLRFMNPTIWKEFDTSCETVHRIVDEIVAEFLLSLDHKALHESGEERYEKQDRNDDDPEPKN